MEGNDIPVTLIVKAPTQQIDDQSIQCYLHWTVKRLKTHLSEVYPCKPNPADQRLIYYGQLLTDDETLRDVFARIDSSDSVHTVHLVCISSHDSYTRSPFHQPPAVAAERLIDDNGIAQPLRNTVPPTPEDAYRFFMNPAGYQPWMNEANAGYFQQLALMQQAYANYYMSQYMDMMARQNGAVYPGQAGAEGNVQRPAEPVRPRLDDDDHNRDWLDYMYVFARLIVLFSIVYFYSSPVRFVIVSFLGIVMYMYQIGFFRIQMQAPGLENNNEILNNNVAAENNNLVQQQQGVQAQEPRVDGQEPPVIGELAAETPPPEPVAVGRPTMFALTWTFLSSFFASLIPETQNAV